MNEKLFFDNKVFYPTPAELAQSILRKAKIEGVKTILEPSAGQGDFVDVLKKPSEISYTLYGASFDIDCIEIDARLQAVLKQKGYRVIYNDFLSFHTFKKYDLVLLNPPFDKGAEHLLKAIEIQAEGGKVVCILNAETLKNPFSNIRKLLKRKLDKLNATIEYQTEAFDGAGAERPTAVEIAVVYIDVPKTAQKSTIYDTLKATPERPATNFENEVYANLPETSDFVNSIIRQFERESACGLNIIKEVWAFHNIRLTEFETTDTKDSYYYRPALKIELSGDTYFEQANNFLKAVRSKYWHCLFNNPAFIGNLTSDLQSKWHSEVGELSNYDFSLYNIIQIKNEIMATMVEGVEQTIEGLFDTFSHRYSWYDKNSQNIHYYNGWKANSAYKVNQKVIIPLNGFYCNYLKQFELEFGYAFRQRLQDVVKVFAFLDNNKVCDFDVEFALQSAKAHCQTKNIDLKYFTIDVFKKGSVHIKFTDLEMLNKFNLFCGKRKGWLPPYYGTTAYDNLSDEDKIVVSEFSGSIEEYNKIYENPEFYQIGVANNKLLIA